MPLRSEPVIRGTGCVNRARPDLWEPWAGNRPGPPGHLRELLQRRVRDGVLLRLIGKWLNAGVLENGTLSYPEAGTPQGGVISPLLSNVFLHYVLDEWFEQEVQPRL